METEERNLTAKPKARQAAKRRAEKVRKPQTSVDKGVNVRVKGQVSAL